MGLSEDMVKKTGLVGENEVFKKSWPKVNYRELDKQRRFGLISLQAPFAIKVYLGIFEGCKTLVQ